eukprot:Opistho-1_new@83339
MKKLILAASLALAGLSAHAENFDISPSFDGYTAGLGVTHTVAGSFVDTFRFNYTGPGLIDGILGTVASLNSLNSQQIVITKITVNGFELAVDAPSVDGTNHWQDAFWAPTSFTGNLTLVVEGVAGNAFSTGAIAASYSGSLNINAAPVPEPESYALMLAGPCTLR